MHYVLDPNHAEVHMFVAGHSTCNNQSMFELSFFVRHGFSGTDYTLKHIAGRDATVEEIRLYCKYPVLIITPSDKI